MNQFHSVIPFVFLILTCLSNLFGQASEQKINESELLSLLQSLAVDDDEVRANVITSLAKSGDPQLERFFELYRQGSVYNWPDESGSVRIVVNEETVMDDDFNEFAPLFEPVSGKPFLVDGKQAKPDLLDLEDISPGRKIRTLVNSSKFLLRLFSKDQEVRSSGVKKCGDPPFLPEAVPFLREIIDDPSVDAKIRWLSKESISLIRFSGKLEGGNSLTDRINALQELGKLKSLRANARIKNFQNELNESYASGRITAGVKRKLDGEITRVTKSLESHKDSVDLAGNLFRGFSYGSVLILMALGLAITFGLMGVINMAHGELMMIGAYVTYEVQIYFGHTPDTPIDSYYFAALPLAFLVSALVGLVMEGVVVRHLYNRPLESLLATWGVGLLLIQLVRIRYGDNIGVNSPTWARGGYEIAQDIVLPYARLYLIGLCVAAVSFVYFILRRTRQGMLIRATMQNRDMARSLGVRTRNVDRFTFALGSGIAGVAGYGWTIIGGVTPDMGQTNFIVDSFLVVVTGGVGELAGVLFSGLGIGVLSKAIEPMEFGDFVVGPVWGKVLLLVFIVAFIQFRPSGLFAPKGRLADKK
ncbi:MAG: urea ABC transporter permease subunit UrtB [Opitutales bacterium]|nr:urea ABC transporter permease subunit UrtB [Opitutales bacterium]